MKANINGISVEGTVEEIVSLTRAFEHAQQTTRTDNEPKQWWENADPNGIIHLKPAREEKEEPEPNNGSLPPRPFPNEDRHNRAWPKPEDEYIRAFYERYFSGSTLARSHSMPMTKRLGSDLNRSPAAVQLRASVLGIPQELREKNGWPKGKPFKTMQTIGHVRRDS